MRHNARLLGNAHACCNRHFNPAPFGIMNPANFADGKKIPAKRTGRN
jgi:hypothetical protein